MKLFDSCVLDLQNLLFQNAVSFEKPAQPCADVGRNQLLFGPDTAFELGGSGLAGMGGILFTEDPLLVPSDGVAVVGPQLNEIKKDCSYARITLVRLKNDVFESGDALYKGLRKIDYTRYHVNPEGFMMRISSMNDRECARVGKQALKDGLSFAAVGSLMIKAYHVYPEVQAVRIAFVTAPDFDFNKTHSILKKAEDITKTLDHLANKVKMDCDACGLKQVCAEVEDLCKEEFGKS